MSCGFTNSGLSVAHDVATSVVVKAKINFEINIECSADLVKQKKLAFLRGFEPLCCAANLC